MGLLVASAIADLGLASLARMIFDLPLSLTPP